MRDPDSFKLSSVIIMDKGAVCYEYRAHNGFGGVNVACACAFVVQRLGDCVGRLSRGIQLANPRDYFALPFQLTRRYECSILRFLLVIYE